MRALANPAYDDDLEAEGEEDDAEEASGGRIRTKVVGVTHENEDGSSRQDIIAQCTEGEILILSRAPDNKHDPNAIEVLTQAGEMCGFLSADLAAEVAPEMDAGADAMAHVLQVTGGEDGLFFGMNIEIDIDGQCH